MTDTEDDPNEVWQYDRALSPAGYLRAIKALGMSRIEAARYLGVSERTARRFATGDGDIPPPVVLLLRALLHYNARPVVPHPPRYARSRPLQPLAVPSVQGDTLGSIPD